MFGKYKICNGVWDKIWVRAKDALQLLILIVLLCVPINVGADVINQSDINYWPPVIVQLEAAYQKDPSNQQVIQSLATAYNNYGILLVQQKQWGTATNYLSLALQLNPDNDSIRKNLSNVYVQQAFEIYNSGSGNVYDISMHDTEKQLLIKALALNPINVNGYILLGDIEYMNQRMPAALEAWQKAASLAPSNKDIQQRLAQITRETNTEEDMQNRYNTYFLVKIDPSLNNLQGFDINDSLNRARVGVSNDFSYIPSKKIPVVVYDAEQYYSTIIQAPAWSEAAYDGKLRIMIHRNRENYAQLNSNIVHEYTHAVIEDLTGGKCPRWLNEGIAKYMEYRHGVAPQITVLALGLNTNTIIPWDKIDAEFSSPEKTHVLLAYQQSYSFVYYLVAKYGLVKLTALLRTLKTSPDLASAFQQVYLFPLQNAQDMWRQWLPRYVQQWAEEPVKLDY